MRHGLLSDLITAHHNTCMAIGVVVVLLACSIDTDGVAHRLAGHPFQQPLAFEPETRAVCSSVLRAQGAAVCNAGL